MAKKKSKFFRKLKNFFKPTVGKLLGLLMAAYFVFSFNSVRNKTVVNYYEVEEGSLVKEHNYTGLVIRREETVPAETGGYIYYYVADGRKAAAGSPVYLIDEGGDLSYYLSTHSDELNNISSSKLKEIRNEIMGDSRDFSTSDFHSIYDLYDSLSAKTVEYSSLSVFNSLSEELESGTLKFQKFSSAKNGTVCCYTDGYEDINEQELTEELFDKSQYHKSTIKAGDLVEAGAAAYKLITDENWYIAFMLSDEDIAELADSSTLKISFPDKGFDTRASFSIVYGNDGQRYGLISMNSYLVQFTSDRFINFEIVTNDASGLKIPDKAIITKDFYVIPTSYLTEDAAGNAGFNKAVIGENGTTYEFVTTDIYSRDDDYCYIECDDESSLKAGDFVMLPAGAELPESTPAETSVPESSSADESQADESEAADLSDDVNASSAGALSGGETASSESTAAESSAAGTLANNASAAAGLYRIAAKMPLKGVYNVNKGYTVFRKIEILESSNGYSIVKKNTSYGLQAYDHIVLDASSVQDGQILQRQ